MRKIRILEMIDKPFLGGGQVHLLTLVKNLDKSRFEIIVAAKGGKPLEDEVRRAGIPFMPVSLGKKISLRTGKDIADILKGNEIDILHTHGGVAGVFGRWAAGKAGTPIIVHTLHGIHYLHYRNPLLKYLYVLQERYFSRRSDAVIFVSEADLEAGKKFRLAPEGKCRLVRNGVDVGGLRDADMSARKRRELAAAMKLSPPVIGTVARLHRQKGVVYLLRAAKLVRRRHPEARFVIVGGGPLEKSLRRRAGKMDPEDHVLLLGERPDAREIVSLFDVFVLPSLWEGLPLALIEAAALGRPIVATDIDGVREVIRPGDTGVLVPAKDPAKLAEALSRLLDDPASAVKMGERAKREIPPLFTLSGMVEKTQRIYMEFAARKLKM
jgi:glycosyltransferase involved in cell wall biosynthesis